MEDFSSIDPLSEDELIFSEDEDEKEMITLLSEMKFNAPFEKYIINTINKILKENYKKPEPLFKEKKYSLEEIIEEFKIYYPILLSKEKKILNKSIDIQPKNFDLNKSDVKIENNTIINLSLGNKKGDSEKSFDNLNSSNSLIKYLDENIKNNQKNSLSKEKKQKQKELKDFVDIYNVKGTEFECHIQILLTQILKCFEKEENSFKLLCNIEYKLGNIYTGIKDMEFDFVINNMESMLLKDLLKYLEKNILILKYKGKLYQIKNSTNFDEILLEIKNVQKFDVLGEIGLNGINDENKTKQFINYSKFFNILLDKNQVTDVDKINLFYEKTGFSKENEKILFFVTDSKFNEIYPYLEGTKLYKAMMDSKENINFVLCYLSSGLNEKIILNKYLINYKEDKKNEIKENKENEEEKQLFEKIKLSNKNYFKSEKFQISCNKLNEFLIGINNIKDKFNKSKDKSIIMSSFRFEIFDISLKLSKNFDEYFLSFNTPIEINDQKYNIDDILTIIYMKNELVREDKCLEILNKLKVKFTTIYLDQDEETLKKQIKKIKYYHSLYKIYLFIGNFQIFKEQNIESFLNNIVADLNITKAHYLILYNPKYSEKIGSYYNTLNSNIYVTTNEKEFTEKLNNVKEKIMFYYNDLIKLIIGKRYYDLLVKIYIQKTKSYIPSSSKSDEKDLIKKINEIFYFMQNLELKDSIPEIINESHLKGLIVFIDEKIKTFIDSEINDDKINNVFKEIKTFVLNRSNIFDKFKSKIKSFCSSYLKSCVFNDYYLNFIEDIIPKLKFQVFNEKIRVFLIEKEKAFNKKLTSKI